MRTSSFVLGATAAVYTFDPDTLQQLSAAAPSFFPSELRGLWSREALRAWPAPRPTFPPFLHSERFNVRALSRPPLDGVDTAVYERNIVKITPGV